MLTMLASATLFGDELVGEYVGLVKADKQNFRSNPQLAFQVHREGDTYKIGIYQDLWKRATPYSTFEAKATNGLIEFENIGSYKFTGEITADKIIGKLTDKFRNKENKEEEFEVKFELPKLDRKSPTLGEKAPKGAVVLFDGKNLDEWRSTNNNIPQAHWKVVKKGKDAYFEVAKFKDANGKDHGGDIATKKKFKDFKLHIEFMIPDEMKKTLGQHRSNSGVHLGYFEVQILDSFGAAGLWNECGSLYKVMPPQINASLPPLKWQTYDIDYKSAKYVNGKIAEYPVITVFHNGMQIQKDIVMKETTEHEGRNRDINRVGEGPVEIKLQDHGNPIMFRNIWVLENK